MTNVIKWSPKTKLIERRPPNLNMKKNILFVYDLLLLLIQYIYNTQSKYNKLNMQINMEQILKY